MIHLYFNMVSPVPDCVKVMSAYGGPLTPMLAARLAKNAMISIVDDDNSVREAANMFIRSVGYVTETFASAEEFLESGSLRDTACLITDVQMPGMSGIDLQSHLKENGHCTPVIFLTAYPDETFRRRAMNEGAFGFLSKPFSDVSLIECLNRALADYRSRGPQ